MEGIPKNKLQRRPATKVGSQFEPSWLQQLDDLAPLSVTKVSLKIQIVREANGVKSSGIGTGRGRNDLPPAGSMKTICDIRW